MSPNLPMIIQGVVDAWFARGKHILVNLVRGGRRLGSFQVVFQDYLLIGLQKPVWPLTAVIFAKVMRHTAAIIIIRTIVLLRLKTV